LPAAFAHTQVLKVLLAAIAAFYLLPNYLEAAGKCGITEGPVRFAREWRAHNADWFSR
jgi:hypothetical protein